MSKSEAPQRPIRWPVTPSPESPMQRLAGLALEFASLIGTRCCLVEAGCHRVSMGLVATLKGRGCICLLARPIRWSRFLWVFYKMEISEVQSCLAVTQMLGRCSEFLGRPVSLLQTQGSWWTHDCVCAYIFILYIYVHVCIADPAHSASCLAVHTVCLVAQMVKNLPAMQETLVRFLGKEDPLEKR